MKNCNTCGSGNPDKAKFCLECGASLENTRISVEGLHDAKEYGNPQDDPIVQKKQRGMASRPVTLTRSTEEPQKEISSSPIKEEKKYETYKRPSAKTSFVEIDDPFAPPRKKVNANEPVQESAQVEKQETKPENIQPRSILPQINIIRRETDKKKLSPSRPLLSGEKADSNDSVKAEKQASHTSVFARNYEPLKQEDIVITEDFADEVLVASHDELDKIQKKEDKRKEFFNKHGSSNPRSLLFSAKASVQKEETEDKKEPVDFTKELLKEENPLAAKKNNKMFGGFFKRFADEQEDEKIKAELAKEAVEEVVTTTRKRTSEGRKNIAEKEEELEEKAKRQDIIQQAKTEDENYDNYYETVLPMDYGKTHKDKTLKIYMFAFLGLVIVCIFIAVLIGTKGFST